jgi:hypothetical protein
MFDIKKAAADLDSMLSDIVVKQGVFVAVNKRLIRYKNYIIVRDDNFDWNVLIVKDKKVHLAQVFLKISAFAVCKLHETGRLRTLEEVKTADTVFKKNYIDSQFYRKTIQKTDNDISRDNAQWRFEIVQANAKQAKDRIDYIFYSSIV